MKVNDFKRLLLNYKGYQEDIKLIENDIDGLWYELAGVKAIRYDKQPTSFNPEMNEVMKLDLLEKLEEKQLEYQAVTASSKLIEKKLSKMSDNDKKMCMKVLCEQISNEKVGREFGYSRSGTWKRLKKAIEKVL